MKKPIKEYNKDDYAKKDQNSLITDNGSRTMGLIPPIEMPKVVEEEKKDKKVNPRPLRLAGRIVPNKGLPSRKTKIKKD